MRGLFGMVGLLLTLAIVGFLIKTQLASTRQGVPALPLSATSSPNGASSGAAVNVKEQAQQVQQQYKQALDAAMQQPRAVVDEK